MVGFSVAGRLGRIYWYGMIGCGPGKVERSMVGEIGHGSVYFGEEIWMQYW